jgi:hypothetical protein
MSLTKTSYSMITGAPANVLDYGAVGDGVADDTTAFLNAIASGAGRINIPDGTYNITSKLTLGIGQTLTGTNFQKVFLVHSFNGDMFEMLEKSQAFNITFTGQGATFTGKGLVMTGSNGRQYVENCSFLDFEDAAIYFNLNAGSQSCFTNVSATRTGATYPSVKYCVVVDDSAFVAAATPRTFINYMSSGFTAFDFGSCNNFFVTNGYIGDCKFNDNSRAVTMSGVRVAYLGTFDIKGANHAFSSCDFGGTAPQSVITTGSAIAIGGCTFNNPPVLDSSSSGFNEITCTQVAYTPVITTSGTAPSLGNGTISGIAIRSGSLVTVTIELTLGSTTFIGTGEIRFSLPTFYPNRNTIVAVNGAAIINQSPTLYTALTQLPAATLQYVRMISCTNSGVVTATSPATWAAGDIFRLQFCYVS